jgi:methylenetetrahydrofolate--tRNA-(uracil-5-)-methyltransferase
MAEADAHQVPAGGALAVDREGFAAGVTAAVRQQCRLVTVVEEEVTDLSALETALVVVASGPSDLGGPICADICRTLDPGGLLIHFFDAAAPIVAAESLDY